MSTIECRIHREQDKIGKCPQYGFTSNKESLNRWAVSTINNNPKLSLYIYIYIYIYLFIYIFDETNCDNANSNNTNKEE